jgi:hypothetical protein
MQPVEPDRERHLDAAQHHGLDVVERDLEAGDGVGGHAASLRRFVSAGATATLPQGQSALGHSLARGAEVSTLLFRAFLPFRNFRLIFHQRNRSRSAD